MPRPFGFKLSEETKRRISESNKGKTISAEHRNAVRLANTGNKYCVGRKASEETRQRLSESHKGQHSSFSTEFKKGHSGPYKGDNHSVIDKRGYRLIRDPNNPKRLRGEHIIKAEKILGRKLKGGNDNEVVHHLNGDKADNRNENLLICRFEYHLGLHARMSYLYQQEHFAAAPAKL